MTVIYPFSTVDQDLALKNVEWMNELGGCKGHDVVTIHDKRCAPNLVSSIHLELSKAFDKVETIHAGAEIDGWPEGANYFFRVAAATLQNRRGCPYFFWMEPDAIPLRAGWLDAIWREYMKAQRPFMGDRVQVENIPLHMSGVGVYPNPLHEYAGEAYRAGEIAWDMAGREQIVPKAHFTKLIEHAWKHPSFKDHSELATQIRPEAVLFHSSKDGSLIDLLRGGQAESRHAHNVEIVGSIPTPATNFPAVPVLADPHANVKGVGGEARESNRITATVSREQGADSRGGGEIPFNITDIFIRTYEKDYEWLFWCLKSIAKFCVGFRKIMVVSPHSSPPWLTAAIYEEFAGKTGMDFQFKMMQDETEDGYLAQQITKMYADVTLDYQPDYILHVDSDVIFTRPTTPQDFFGIAKLPIWYYTPYSAIETPWQPITEKFMGRRIENEFMRRFPILVPRWLYPRVREFCNKQHGMIISQYIRNQPLRAFSEFNVLGAYAWEFHRSMFDFVNTITAGQRWDDAQGGMVYEMPEPMAKQYHSWGGITPEIRTEIENTLRGTEAVMLSASQAATCPKSPAANSVPPQIKKLPNGLWVIEGDTHISKWIEQQQRLDHDQNLLPFILPHLKEGDVVIDAGAFVGDHTIAYSRAVGATGVVHAFEPNPVAYICLQHNMNTCGNVVLHNVGLSDRDGFVPLSGNNGNYGGCYAGEHMKIADVQLQTLDDIFRDAAWVDFIKLDIEGCEAHALRGAEQLIKRFHPKMVIEVNVEALGRQGSYPGEIFNLLKEFGYEWQIIQENCCKVSPLYDILCTPKNRSPEAVKTDSPKTKIRKSGQRLVVYPTVPPPVTLSNFRQHIEALSDFASRSSHNRMLVMQRLAYCGLKRKEYKRKT